MSDYKLESTNINENRTWKRLGYTVLKESLETRHEPNRPASLFKRLIQAVATVFLNLVDKAARLVNKPVVDIGREYSVSALQERIATLEDVLIRQWSNSAVDPLSPSDELKQYVAACHVARQYERVSKELLAKRLDVSPATAAMLLDRMESEGVITESYTITYHDVRHTIIEAAIEHQVDIVRRAAGAPGTAETKKH